jgi:tRNA(fMet)-specific endonuclease VapC
MDSVLLDTDVFSYILKNDSRGRAYQSHIQGKRACLSFMTVAELYRWTIMRNWQSKRVDQMRNEIKQHVVIPFDDAMAWQWAQIMSQKGRPMASSDAWIAATAVRYDIPLVTHNRQHFAHVPGLRTISEAA